MNLKEYVEAVCKVGGEMNLPALTLEIYLDNEMNLIPSGMNCATVALALEQAPEEVEDETEEDIVDSIVSQL